MQKWSTKDEIEMSIRTFQSFRAEIKVQIYKIESQNDEHER